MTFAVLSPEHHLMSEILDLSPNSNELLKYIDNAKNKSEFERMSLTKEKTGVDTGLSVINPVNGKKVSLWIADYVLINYGTGAIMAVPGHDQRDYDFAKKYDIEIIQVISDKEKKSSIQSRACAVLSNGKYIFALPGSPGGVTDAWDKILVHQLDINHKPCNFVELFPRLKEK